jgi:YidC/Oxa1 family membrane protein insertase
MANLPVESMKTGGLFWFPDLTIADPYFLLPILCSASMLLTIEVGHYALTRGEEGMQSLLGTCKNVDSCLIFL